MVLFFCRYTPHPLSGPTNNKTLIFFVCLPLRIIHSFILCMITSWCGNGGIILKCLFGPCIVFLYYSLYSVVSLKFCIHNYTIYTIIYIMHITYTFLLKWINLPWMYHFVYFWFGSQLGSLQGLMALKWSLNKNLMYVCS